MKWWAAASAVFIFATVATFLFAPVVFWYDAGGGPIGVGGAAPYRPVFRSFGCVFFGYGDVYAPGMGGVRMGCQGPPVPL